jgi:hypothetical protein
MKRIPLRVRFTALFPDPSSCPSLCKTLILFKPLFIYCHSYSFLLTPATYTNHDYQSLSKSTATVKLIFEIILNFSPLVHTDAFDRRSNEYNKDSINNRFVLCDRYSRDIEGLGEFPLRFNEYSKYHHSIRRANSVA